MAALSGLIRVMERAARKAGGRLRRDFGEIVFKLIEYNVLSKTENDCLEDFAEVFDFNEAFLLPYVPETRRLPRPPPWVGYNGAVHTRGSPLRK